MTLAYLYCGRILHSGIAISELPLVHRRNATLSFTLANKRPQAGGDPWTHDWFDPDGEKVLSHRKARAYHFLRFPGLADFRISLDASRVTCHPCADTGDDTIRHLLLDQVLPRCLAHQGELVLHASAVLLGQKVVLFMGESRSGKSTLAASFHRAGHPAVSDDVVLIEQREGAVRALPSYGGLRLWDDSLAHLFRDGEVTTSVAHYSTKKRLPLSGQPATWFSDGIDLMAVVILDPPHPAPRRQVRLDPLSPRETFIEIEKQAFRLDPGDANRIHGHMQHLGQIVPRLSSLKLAAPREYDQLPAVRSKILAQLT